MRDTYWLGDTVLDRYVYELVKPHNGVDIAELHALVCQKLQQERIVAAFQLLPDENMIWCSLQRLVQRQQVRKFVSDSGPEPCIRYRRRR